MTTRLQSVNGDPLEAITQVYAQLPEDVRI
jgi:hypothetical protein